MPPPPRKRTGMKVTLIVIGLVGLVGLVGLLCCGGGLVAAGIYFNSSVAQEKNATLTVPESVAGLPKSTNTDLQNSADKLANSVDKIDGVKQSVAAVYDQGGDEQHMIIAFAATGNVANPTQELNASIAELGNGMGTPITNIRSKYEGSMSGSAKCGSGTMSSGSTRLPVTVCVWSDHGSIGGAVFFNRGVDESARIFVDIRNAMLHRG